MTTTAASVIRRTVDTLTDVSSVQWTIDELVRYLNDGQLAITIERPDATYKMVSDALVAGIRQTIPSDGLKVIDITRNSNTGKAVRMCNREVLDAANPSWPSMTPVAEIIHFMLDPREPDRYYVYPPATTAARVDLIYSQRPVLITEPTPGQTYANVDGNLTVQDLFATALNDYILFRAFSKNANAGSNAQRAASHFQLFKDAIASEVKATVDVTAVSGVR